jgi:hypothetical protein
VLVGVVMIYLAYKAVVGFVRKGTGMIWQVQSTVCAGLAVWLAHWLLQHARFEQDRGRELSGSELAATAIMAVAVVVGPVWLWFTFVSTRLVSLNMTRKAMLKGGHGAPRCASLCFACCCCRVIPRVCGVFSCSHLSVAAASSSSSSSS